MREALVSIFGQDGAIVAQYIITFVVLDPGRGGRIGMRRLCRRRRQSSPDAAGCRGWPSSTPSPSTSGGGWCSFAATMSSTSSSSAAPATSSSSRRSCGPASPSGPASRHPGRRPPTRRSLPPPPPPAPPRSDRRAGGPSRLGDPAASADRRPPKSRSRSLRDGRSRPRRTAADPPRNRRLSRRAPEPLRRPPRDTAGMPDSEAVAETARSGTPSPPARTRARQRRTTRTVRPSPVDRVHSRARRAPAPVESKPGPPNTGADPVHSAFAPPPVPVVPAERPAPNRRLRAATESGPAIKSTEATKATTRITSGQSREGNGPPARPDIERTGHGRAAFLRRFSRILQETLTKRHRNVVNQLLSMQ